MDHLKLCTGYSMLKQSRGRMRWTRLCALDIAAVARAVQAEKTIGNWKQTAVAHATASSDSDASTASASSSSSSSSAVSSSSPETRVMLHKRSASRAECLAACAAVGSSISITRAFAARLEAACTEVTIHAVNTQTRRRWW